MRGIKSCRRYRDCWRMGALQSEKS